MTVAVTLQSAHCWLLRTNAVLPRNIESPLSKVQAAAGLLVGHIVLQLPHGYLFGIAAAVFFFLANLYNETVKVHDS